MATAARRQEARIAESGTSEVALTGGKNYILKQEDGKPIAIILPWEQYQALLERLEDLEDFVEADEAMAEYEQDPSTGRSWEDVEADLVTKGVFEPNA